MSDTPGSSLEPPPPWVRVAQPLLLGCGHPITHIPGLPPGTFPPEASGRHHTSPGLGPTSMPSFPLSHRGSLDPPLPSKDRYSGCPSCGALGLVGWIQDDPTLPCPLSGILGRKCWGLGEGFGACRAVAGLALWIPAWL